MREIKFRAWHKREQSMYDVYYLNFSPDGTLSGALVDFDKPFYKISCFELMQFTGLKDKHGKEMYEGDIVRYLDNTSTGLVEKTVEIEDIRSLPDFTCSKWEEIIGNVYEPELHRVEQGNEHGIME